MDLRQSELEKLNIETKDGVFTPVYVYEEIKLIHENDEAVDYEYINFEIKMTAEENYNEWLKNKDKLPEVTEMELLKTKLDFATKQIEQQEELIVELAMKVYQ